jgi:hypothetical protein
MSGFEPENFLTVQLLIRIKLCKKKRILENKLAKHFSVVHVEKAPLTFEINVNSLWKTSPSNTPTNKFFSFLFRGKQTHNLQRIFFIQHSSGSIVLLLCIISENNSSINLSF